MEQSSDALIVCSTTSSSSSSSPSRKGSSIRPFPSTFDKEAARGGSGMRASSGKGVAHPLREES